MEKVSCLGCGYDIFSTPTEPATGMWNCPECGRGHTNAELSSAATERVRKAKWWRTVGVPCLCAGLLMGVLLILLLLH